jgi:hypothetical protein
MENRRSAGSGAVGYGVVLLGVVAFVVGSLAPYVEYTAPMSYSASLYRLLVLRPGTTVEHVGGFLFLFAGVATLALLSIAGLRGSGGSTRVALTAVGVSWSLSWIGTLLGGYQFLSPHKVGYWSTLVSVGVIAAGATIVWVSPLLGGRLPARLFPEPFGREDRSQVGREPDLP